jgi:predicted alpha/beta-hydrolase family hydrolase
LKRFSVVNSLLLALLFCGLSAGATVETVKVKTSRGAEVAVAINVPDSPAGKHPAVIIAPGQGYHKELSIIKELAEVLAANGILAFRFDWNYFSSVPQGQPSENLSKEVEDMQAVVSLARSDPRVDAAQLIIGGKSLGSVVAFEVFKKNAESKALFLLTPLCSSATDANGKTLAVPISIAADNYNGFTTIAKPVVMALGNNDPACSVPILYDFLKATKGNAVTIVVGGDHSLNVTSGADAVSAKRNADNVSQSVRIIAHWVNLILGK